MVKGKWAYALCLEESMNMKVMSQNKPKNRYEKKKSDITLL